MTNESAEANIAKIWYISTCTLFAHERFACENVARAFFLIPVFRKESLLQYTYMFSFTFGPAVLPAFSVPFNEDAKGKRTLSLKFISIIL